MEYFDTDDARDFSGEEYQKVNLFQTDRMFCDVYCFEPGQEQEPHTHAGSDKIYYVLEGEGTFSIGDEVKTLGEGNAVVAKPGEEHGVKNESDERLRTLVFMA
ncbi:MAG: cupin domain-containing protein, partial [Halobacteria archaeon]|nr:cupin domain-containing protein [Halobacteria archaeon]